MVISEQTYQYFYQEKTEKQLNFEKKLYGVVYAIFALGLFAEIAFGIGMIR